MMQKQYEKGHAEPVTKSASRTVPIADADKNRRAALRAFQSGDAIAEPA